MEFCPICQNLLFPRGNKLYCNACDYERALSDKDFNTYKLIKIINHSEKDLSPIIIKEPFHIDNIFIQDGKVYDGVFI